MVQGWMKWWVECKNCRWKELITTGSSKDMVGSLVAVDLRADTKVETDTRKIKLTRCRPFSEFRAGTSLSVWGKTKTSQNGFVGFSGIFSRLLRKQKTLKHLVLGK